MQTLMLFLTSLLKMYLKYFIDAMGRKKYTLKREDPRGEPTFWAHPARFSPEDKNSKYRILIKKRFNILKTQEPARPM